MMSLQESWLIVGKIGRPHGLRGEMVVHWTVAPESWLFSLKQLALAQSEGQWSTIHIKQWRHLAGNKSLLRCSQVLDCEQARAWISADLAIHRSWLPVLPEKEWYLLDTIGAEVIDQHQHCWGRIVRLLDGPAQPFAVVAQGQQEHYLPLVPQWICRFMPSEKQLHMQLPEGLFPSSSGVV